MRPEVPLEGDVGAADRGSETGPVSGPRQRADIGSRHPAGREKTQAAAAEGSKVPLKGGGRRPGG